MAKDQQNVTCLCGSNLFFESTRANGWWKAMITGEGEVVETDLDSVKYGTYPKTVKCAECNRVCRNPRKV